VGADRTFVQTDSSVVDERVIAVIGLRGSRIAQSLHPVVSFSAVRRVDLDARQLERTLALPLMAALLDPQVGLQDAVDGLGGATGADDAFQDGQQFFCQGLKLLIIGDQLSHQGQGFV